MRSSTFCPEVDGDLFHHCLSWHRTVMPPMWVQADLGAALSQ